MRVREIRIPLYLINPSPRISNFIGDGFLVQCPLSWKCLSTEVFLASKIMLDLETNKRKQKYMLLSSIENMEGSETNTTYSVTCLQVAVCLCSCLFVYNLFLSYCFFFLLLTEIRYTFCYSV